MIKTVSTSTLRKTGIALAIYLFALIVVYYYYDIQLVSIFIMMIIANRLERLLVVDKTITSTTNKLHTITEQLEQIKDKPLHCYYLISEEALQVIKPRVSSKPIDHYGKNVYVSIFSDTDFEIIQYMYKQLTPQQQSSFWIEQIVPGKVDISNFNFNMLTFGNLFSEIENQLSITKTNNIAMTVFAICNKLNISPIQLFNQSK